VFYVTARKPERVVEVPAYLEKHGIPTGPIETGTSGAPFIARPEKVRDIKSIFAQRASQRFVLFGDTTHVDTEVQHDILAAAPERVIAGIILKTTAVVPPEKVEGLHLVSDYAEAAAVLVKLKVITRDEALGVMRSARDEGLAITDARMNALLEATN
jgi:phosphatidate phosphatase APP1